MTIEVLKQLNIVFKKHTGKPITLLSYEIDELNRRLTIVEDLLKKSMPVMAASTLKVEAVAKCLSDLNIIQDSAIEDAQKKILIENKNVLK